MGQTFSEPQLAEGLRRGDRDAWLALNDAYAAPLWRRVARLIGGGDPSAVPDVVQATLLSAAESAPTSFDPARGAIWPWLCGIARNQVALYRRRRGPVMPPLPFEARDAHGAPKDTPWSRWLAGEADDPPAQMEIGELAEVVRQALGGLSVEYQSLLLDRYVDAISAEDIARRDGTTGQAIRSKLARARHAFRDEFERLAPSLAAEHGLQP